MKHFSIITLMIIVFSTQHGLKGQDVASFVIQPPELRMENVTKIAILNFENADNASWYAAYGGATFVNYLTERLLDERRGIHNVSGSGIFSGTRPGKSHVASTSINIYQIVEREQLTRILRERSLDQHIALDNNQAAEIGRILGIDVLIMGTVKHTGNTSRTYSIRKDGSREYCTENTCETEINIKVVSVADASILGTRTFRCTHKDKKCGNVENRVRSIEQIADANMKQIALDAACYLAPHYVLVRADLQKIKVKEFRSHAENMKAQMQNEEFSKVYALNKAIYDADNYNAESAYNLALLHFITGGYAEAAQWMEIATSINPRIAGSLGEVFRNFGGYQEVLETYGVLITPFDFTTANTGDALAEKVVTKGRKSDRHDVYSEPDVSSSVAGRVPGSTEFIMVGRSGDFIHIRMLGEREGYIHKDLVK